MQYKLYKTLILIVCILSNHASYACKESFNLSKKKILIGSLFSGKNLSLFGNVCQDRDYKITIYGPNREFNIIKKEFHGILVHNEKFKKEFFNYLYVIKTSNLSCILQKDMYNKLSYEDAEVIIQKLQDMNLYKCGDIKIYDNNVIKEKITIPQNANTGEYRVVIEVYNQNGDLINAMNDSFFVELSGFGKFMQNLYTFHRAEYLFLSVILVLLISIVSMIVKSYSKKVCNIINNKSL